MSRLQAVTARFLRSKYASISVAQNVLRYTCAFWIIAGFILPNTLVDHISLHGLLPSNEARFGELWSIGVGGTVFALMVALHVKPCINDIDRILALGFLLVYGSWYFIGAYEQRYGGLLGTPHVFVLIALAAGLGAGWMCATLERLSRLLIFSLTAQAAYALTYYLNGGDAFLSGTVKRAVGTFSDPQDVCRCLLFGLPLCFVLAFTSKKTPLVRYTWWGFFAVMLVGMVLTYDRGGLLALCVGLTWATLRLGRQRAITIYVAICLVIVTCIVFHTRSAGEVNRMSSEHSVEGRYRYWKQALTIVSKHPLGVGVNGVVLLAYAGDGKSLIGWSDDPKSLYMFWLDIMGFPGLIFLILLILSIAKILRRNHSAEAIGVAAAWISILIAGIFDTPVGTTHCLPSTALAGALLSGMLVSRHVPSNEASNKACPLLST